MLSSTAGPYLESTYAIITISAARRGVTRQSSAYLATTSWTLCLQDNQQEIVARFFVKGSREEGLLKEMLMD